jgi:uncharacterized membrane protein YphA (DoxX/SURF4 family)
MQGALKIMRFHWWSLRTLCSNLFIHGQKRTIVSIFLIFFFFFFFFFFFSFWDFCFSFFILIKDLSCIFPVY